MKQALNPVIQEAISNAFPDLILNKETNYQLNMTREEKHGDFACNVAMILSGLLKMPPKIVAEKLVNHLPNYPWIERVEIAGPGFINFYLNIVYYQKFIKEIIETKEQFGRSNLGKQSSIHLEYVSVNPTGPLHVGHGRHAVYGSALANCLEAIGYKVHREFYVNDAGRQMDILATSVWIRYLNEIGISITFPSSGYQGEYVLEISKALLNNNARKYNKEKNEILQNLPNDKDRGGDQDKYIDALILRCKELLGDKSYREIHQFTLQSVLRDIREDLESFGVFQEWFSEQSLLEKKAVEEIINILNNKQCLYEQDGALWFRATDYGDEKDRVLIRANGQYTYFATDIANHHYKYQRGFKKIIDVWGADHHGYIPRMKAAIKALGYNEDSFLVLLVQFVTLYRGKKQVQMSTRSGSFITLRELRKEVGNDAARFFYILRKSDQHMDFDIDLAKSQSMDNPVYYIQYAYARISSVMRQMNDKGFTWNQKDGLNSLNLLTSPYEKKLMKELFRYPHTLEASAIHYEPHQLANYLKELAHSFHAYYNASTFLVGEEMLRNARISLILAAQQVLKNGMDLLGITTPESM